MLLLLFILYDYFILCVLFFVFILLVLLFCFFFFFFSSRRRHTRWPRDWSSDVCSSDLNRRVLVVVSKVVLACVLCIGLYIGVRWGAERLFFENPDYQVSTIEVQTDGKIGRASCRERVKNAEGGGSVKRKKKEVQW